MIFIKDCFRLRRREGKKLKWNDEELGAKSRCALIEGFRAARGAVGLFLGGANLGLCGVLDTSYWRATSLSLGSPALSPLTLSSDGLLRDPGVPGNKRCNVLT